MIDNNKNTILVTGASRGIGKSICEKFFSHAFNVIGCSRRKPEDHSKFTQIYFETNLDKKEEVLSLFNEIKNFTNKIDILVNNAGMAKEDSMHQDDGETWYNTFNTNIHSTYHCTKEALKMMPESYGRIINISSTLGLRGALKCMPTAQASML